jgi:hypothetical protein
MKACPLRSCFNFTDMRFFSIYILTYSITVLIMYCSGTHTYIIVVGGVYEASPVVLYNCFTLYKSYIILRSS